MDERPEDAHERRHVWPWYVLAAILLAIALAIAWMSVAVRHVRATRDPMAQPSLNDPGGRTGNSVSH